MSLCGKISADIVKNCATNKPTMGLEQKIILINEEDLKPSGISFDATYPDELITQLALEAGMSGFLVEGLKQVMNYGNSFENPGDGESGVIHAINGIRFQDNSVQAQKQLNQLVAGARVFAVVERKWKGINSANAFRFFGVQFGLELKEMTDASNENDGTIVISLGTPEGFKEAFVPHQLLDTDYDTTLTAFNNKFAAAP